MLMHLFLLTRRNIFFFTSHEMEMGIRWDQSCEGRGWGLGLDFSPKFERKRFASEGISRQYTGWEPDCVIRRVKLTNSHGIGGEGLRRIIFDLYGLSYQRMWKAAIAAGITAAE